MFERTSGVLMHITSLPSPYGIGSMGADARAFVDFLRDAGQRYWQVLPLGRTGFGASPYQCFSAAAGNPLLIDLDTLVEDGLLTAEEALEADPHSSPDQVDFEEVEKLRYPVLRKAFARVTPKLQKKIDAYAEREKDWLPDFTLFMSLREVKYECAALWDWPDADVLHRKPKALAAAREELAEEIAFRTFLQYEFSVQWHALRKYANKNGVQIIGDIPIYVSPDSADVWENPKFFKLKSDFSPRKIAGVPPDYFSATGQLWGNPVYDWDALEKDGFKWWIWRMKQNMELYDVVRLDHFRGFESYWEVDAGEETAVKGQWLKGPGMRLFRAIEKELGKIPIIAEDLGIITDDVRKLLDESGFPGMRVMIFGFNSWEDNCHLPHNYVPNSIVYTSTHDSQTICEQIMDLCGPADADFARDYIRWNGHEPLAWAAIKTLFFSPASIAMTQMQDVLNLGADARMNKPATVGGQNWRWRMRRDGMNSELSGFLRGVTVTSRRYKPYQPPVEPEPEEAPETEEKVETKETASTEKAAPTETAKAEKA